MIAVSKRVFQENKARQIFYKTNISYPLIRTRVCQGVRNVCFSENLACSFLETSVLRFDLLPYYRRIIGHVTSWYYNFF